MKKDMFRRTKENKAVIAIGIVGILLLVSINVMSTTTWTNVPGGAEAFTTDMSDLEIDFANNWIRVDNISLNATDEPHYNGSDSAGYTWELADIWNASATSGAPSHSLIVNSKNNSWTVNEANLALAIEDQGEAGTVWIGGNLTLTSPIYLRCGQTGGNPDPIHSLTLDFQGHTVTLSADIEFINLTGVKYSTVKNVRVVTYSKHENTSIIKLHANNLYGEGIDWSYRVDYNTFENINILGSGLTNHNWTGINLSIEPTHDSRIDTNTFKNIIIYGSAIGIQLFCDDPDGYINGNTFEDIYIDQFVDAISFDTLSVAEHGGSVNDVNENTFDTIKGQAGLYSVYGLKNISGTGNTFREMLWWDWSVTENPQYEYWIGVDSVNTRVEALNVGASNRFLDEGLGSIIEIGNKEMYYDSDYDYFITKVGSYYYARLGLHGDMPVSGSYDRTTDFQALMYGILGHDNIKVKIGEGIFEPDQYVNVRGKNITIEGTSDYGTIIKCENGTQYATGLFTANDEAYSNLTLRYLVFSGDGASDSSRGLYFASSESMYGLDVEHCKFVNWVAGTSQGIYSRPSTNDHVYFIRIVDTDFFNCDYGIHFDGDDDSDVNQSMISGNEFHRCDVAIVLDYVNYSIITDNIIKHGVTEGISLQGNSSYNIITNNQIQATTGIELDAGCNSNIVSLNMLYLCTTKVTNSGIANYVANNMGESDI